MKTIHLAGCIMQNREGHILLLHRNTVKRTQWEIPGGKIEEGENPAQTAEREVEEELGVKVKVQDELDTKAFQEDEFVMKYTWFKATILSGEPCVMEPQNHDECRYFSIEALEKIADELSPNAVNFVRELRAGRIVL